MNFKIVTKQLAKQLPIDHELNKETTKINSKQFHQHLQRVTGFKK